jgi:isoquinoline 1-oxidoreductase subunit beta
MSEVQLVSRRGFLGGMFSAGALILAAQLLPAKGRDALAAAQGSASPWYPSVYLGIEPSGTVIIVAHRSEMGTGIRTALPMVAADELDADWTRVTIEQAIGDPQYGDQNTDGSKSMRDFYDALRQAGATGRLMLERAAAAKWGVPAAQCQARNHQIIDAASGRSLGYGELATLAAQQPVPKKEELRFKLPSEFRYIGKGMPIVDLDDICMGRATYGFDAQMPGMVYASIARSPVIGGTLKSYDDQDTRQVHGVQQTVVIPPAKAPYAFQALGGVAVIADSTWAAMQGRQKLKVEWDPGENASYDSEAYKKSLFETAEKPQKVVRNVGNVDAAFASASTIHEAEYYVPHLAHAALEPPAAVAEYKDGKVVAWAATQNPQAVQDTVASALKIDKKDVICHVTLLGGGFGRKSKPDYVAEAAILSKTVGKPVKVAWSREDDIHFDYYHTVAAMYMKAATDAQGRPTAWLQRSVFPPISSTFDASARYGADGELAQGWVDLPFDIPNLRAENGPAQNHVRIGWLRSVANIYHGFAIQSFIDELAAAAGRDRVEFFLDVLGRPRQIDYKAEGTTNANYGKPLDLYPVDTGRLRRVIEVVAERSGWANKKPSKGHAWGFAAHRSFLSYVAAVVEVEIDDQGQVRIPRVDLAVDAGRVVHPERVQAQFEGAAVFATGVALMNEITAVQGQIQQSNFQDYPVPRINEAPYETHVYLLPSDDLPVGVGEPGVPPTIPAICNALFVATGKRIRQLPIKNTKLT